MGRRNGEAAQVKRRGFTMVETLMAATLGAAVVVVCVGLFASMERTDRATSLRFDQTSALSRVHLVMRRTFGNVVMSDSSVRGGPLGTAPAGTATAGTPETESAVRPRILLEKDSNANFSGSGAAPQRLEVVLSKAPVPPVLNTARGEAIAMAAYEPSVYAGPTIRGVFELRPDPPFAEARNWGVPGLDPRKTGWTLWWRPLPHSPEGPAGALFSMQPEEDPSAVPIASGLEMCRWLAFNKRKRGDAFTATQFQELPAYMELEIRTTTGLTANWMFEVDWINGPETVEELDEQRGEQLAGPGAPAGGREGDGVDRGGRTVNERGATVRTFITDDGRTITAQPGDQRPTRITPDAQRQIEDIRRRRGTQR
jgi:hypothetical protein